MIVPPSSKILRVSWVSRIYFPSDLCYQYFLEDHVLDFCPSDYDYEDLLNYDTDSDIQWSDCRATRPPQGVFCYSHLSGTQGDGRNDNQERGDALEEVQEGRWCGEESGRKERQGGFWWGHWGQIKLHWGQIGSNWSFCLQMCLSVHSFYLHDSVTPIPKTHYGMHD